MSDRKLRNPISRKLQQSAWWAPIGGVLVLIVFAIGATWYAAARPWESLVIGAGVATLFVLLLLGTRFPWVARWLGRFGAAYLWTLARLVLITLWYGAVIVPIWAARSLADLAADASLPVAVGLLLVWLGVFLFLIRQISTESHRRALWRKLSRRYGRMAPFLYTFTLAWIAIILFGSIAFILADRELIQFGSDPAMKATIAAPADVFDFFLWHLLDSVPGLTVTETLRWTEPLGYSNARVGALLLAFKVVVIVPIIAAFIQFWRYRHEAASS